MPTAKKTPLRLSVAGRASLAKGKGEDRSVDVVASTDAINCYGYIVDQKGWDLSRYESNAIVLYSHNEQAGMGFDDYEPEDTLPIGRASNVRVEDGSLKATITFATSAVSDLAERCYQAFREGVLNAVSVGFDPLDVVIEMRDGEEVPVVKRAQLLEISVVPLPGDPGAVRETQALSLTHLRSLALPKGKSMKLITNELRLSAEAGEGDVVTAIQQLRAPVAELLSITGEASTESALGVLQAWKLSASKLVEAQQTIATLSAEKDSREIETIISEAKAAKKITPAMEPEIRELAKLSMERARSLIKALPTLTQLTASPTTQPGDANALGKKWSDYKPMELHMLRDENPSLFEALRAERFTTTGR